MSPLDQDENQEEEAFDFSKYYVDPSKETAIQEEAVVDDNEQEFDFSKYRVKEKETTSEMIGRNIAQNTARTGEFFLGLPGNLKKAYSDTLDQLGLDFLKIDKREGEELTQEQDFIFNPPTSKEIREKGTKSLAEKAFGDPEYLEPRGKIEKATGDTTQDIASFFTPGTGQTRLAVRIGAPILGNLIKEGAKIYGADEELADKIKLGTMLMTTVAGSSNPSAFSSERIGRAKSMIPQNATADSRSLLQGLDALERRLQRGLPVPSKSNTFRGIQELRTQAANGTIEIHSLMDARDNINEWIAEAGGWDVPGNVRDASVRNLNNLKSEVINSVENNLQTQFPEAAELYRTGYQAAAVVHRSNAISNFIRDNFGRKAVSLSTKVMFPTLVGGATVIPKTAIGVGTTYPIYKTAQVMYRIGNSPTLARYYQEIITNAAAKNAPAMNASIAKFDKEMKKDEKKLKKKNQFSQTSFREQFQ